MEVEAIETLPVNTESATDFFERVYENGFKRVAKYISSKHGTFEDAKDIFHDALVIYYEKPIPEKLKIKSEEAYLLGIAKNLWATRYGNDIKKTEVTDTNIDSINIDEPILINETSMLHFLEKSGKKCMDLLVAFYMQNLSIDRIKKNFGFSSAHSASVQKYKCIEKIRQSIKEKSMTYEDFFE